MSASARIVTTTHLTVPEFLVSTPSGKRSLIVSIASTVLSKLSPSLS